MSNSNWNVKIFWSWQSDTPGKTGRFLIRDALRDAIDQLKAAPDIEEPRERESREKVHLDYDIQGTTGSPDLTFTILKKIRESEIVVADVTPVGATPDITDPDGNVIPGKKLINSNVAIELGYATHAVTDERVLMVFNEHYGGHEDLPFNLRHKGGAIVFNLPPNAERERIREEQKKLRDRFVQALKPLFQRVESPPTFLEKPSTFNKAAYFQLGEVLATYGTSKADELSYVYETSDLCYLRLIPVSALPQPLSQAELARVIGITPVLKGRDAVAQDRNPYGAIRLQPGSHPPSGRARISSSTQLFQNGELWSITDSLIVTDPDRHPGVPHPFLPCLGFEQCYYDALHSLLRFAKNELHLEPPWQIECGMVGIKGLYLAVYASDGVSGPIHINEIIRRVIINNIEAPTINEALLQFFRQVYDAAGDERPSGLYGFPPDRPHA